MKPEKKRTGAILIGLTLFVLAMCSGYVALAYDAQPGTQRLFDGQDLNAVTVASVDLWNDPRGRDGTCMDEDALKDYLASLEPELYTEKLDEYASGEQRELTVMLETPQGRLSVRLLDQAVHVARLWGGPDFHTDSYYLRTPTDWAYLDTLIAPVPNLQLIFLNNRVDRVVCRSLTRTAADGTVRVLLASEDWRYNEYLNEDVQEVQLGFSLPLAGPYTVTVEPLRGGRSRRTICPATVSRSPAPMRNIPSPPTCRARTARSTTHSMFSYSEKKHPEHKPAAARREGKPDHELDLWVLQA